MPSTWNIPISQAWDWVCSWCASMMGEGEDSESLDGHEIRESAMPFLFCGILQAGNLRTTVVRYRDDYQIWLLCGSMDYELKTRVVRRMNGLALDISGIVTRCRVKRSDLTGIWSDCVRNIPGAV